MTTPSEPNPGPAGLSSQPAQAKPITYGAMVENMSQGELLNWLKENKPEEFKLLVSMAKEEMETTDNTNINNSAFYGRPPSQRSAILRAWKKTYFLHSLVALRDLVRQYQLLDVQQYYAKTLVFVQSRGMGKSRLADAFGQLCPMINFVLRDYWTSGFPPPDHEILSFLGDRAPDDIPGPTSEQGISRETSSDFLKRRAVVAWNHTLAAALLQASFETCKLAIFFETLANSSTC